MSFLMTILFCFQSPAFLMAQSDSYFDTIYQAVDGGESSGYNGDVLANDPGDGEPLVIETDDPDAKVTIGDEPPSDTDTNTSTGVSTDSGNPDQKEMDHVNEVFSEMTRIIIGMNMGITVDTSSFVLIDLDGSGTNTNTNIRNST